MKLSKSIRRAACVAALSLSITPLTYAQSEPIDNDMVKKIKEEGMDRSKVMETISFLTDVHGPRLTGAPETKIAGEWARKRLDEWGLENAQ